MTGLELKIFSLGLKPGLALLPLHAEVQDLHKIALGFITPLGMGHGIQQTDLKLITKNIRKNNFLKITITYFHLLPTILHIFKDKNSEQDKASCPKEFELRTDLCPARYVLGKPNTCSLI